MIGAWILTDDTPQVLMYCDVTSINLTYYKPITCTMLWLTAGDTDTGYRH